VIAMSNDGRTAKLKAGLASKWANQPRGETSEKISGQRKELWAALNQFITENGGWTTSVPGYSPIRFEATEHSRLPLELTKLGYTLLPRGTTTRIGSGGSEYSPRLRKTIPSAGYGFLTVAVYELDLPR
jgi:hypothetical protein